MACLHHLTLSLQAENPIIAKADFLFQARIQLQMGDLGATILDVRLPLVDLGFHVH